MTARVTVHCSVCSWSGQRSPATATASRCPGCDSRVRRAREGAGRPPLPAADRRVPVRGSLSPAAARWLVALARREPMSPERAEVLDLVSSKR